MPQENFSVTYREWEMAKNTIENLSRIRTRLEMEVSSLKSEAQQLRAIAKSERLRSDFYENQNFRLKTLIEKYEAICPTMSEAQKVRYLRDMETYERIMSTTNNEPQAIVKMSKHI